MSEKRTLEPPVLVRGMLKTEPDQVTVDWPIVCQVTKLLVVLLMSAKEMKVGLSLENLLFGSLLDIQPIIEQRARREFDLHHGQDPRRRDSDDSSDSAPRSLSAHDDAGVDDMMTREAARQEYSSARMLSQVELKSLQLRCGPTLLTVRWILLTLPQLPLGSIDVLQLR